MPAPIKFTTCKGAVEALGPKDTSQVTPDPARVNAALADRAALPAAAGGSPTIDAAMQSYMAWRCAGYRDLRGTGLPCPASGQMWCRNSGANFQAARHLMVRLLGNKTIDDITPDELRAGFALVERLPRGYRATVSPLAPVEAAEQADQTERRRADLIRLRLEAQGACRAEIETAVSEEKLPRFRAALVYRFMQDFRRVCAFHVRLGTLDENIMAGVIWSKKEYDRRVLEEAPCGPLPRSAPSLEAGSSPRSAPLEKRCTPDQLQPSSTPQ